MILPVRNAEESLPEALDSVLSQDYEGPVEVVVADGSDGAATAGLVRRRYPSVRLVPNPGVFAAAGMNAGLRASSGEIIARCDAHSVLPGGYLRRAVATLARTGAANVGGRQQPAGRSFFERAVAIAMTIRAGAGGARYRLGGGEGPVDTVYLGVFRRDALDAAGGYDPALGRNEDYELNWRLRARGETVWFDPGLAVRYRPRGSPGSLARQYFDSGRWKRLVLGRGPASLRPRHLAAPLVLVGLVAGLALELAGLPAGRAILLGYLALLAGAAAVAGLSRRDPAAILVPAALAAMHLAWGAGFFTPGRPTRQ